ncbi:MAG: hypothetical protein ACYSUB_22690, partial [Planctomycetota bacterium]
SRGPDLGIIDRVACRSIMTLNGKSRPTITKIGHCNTARNYKAPEQNLTHLRLKCREMVLSSRYLERDIGLAPENWSTSYERFPEDIVVVLPI